PRGRRGRERERARAAPAVKRILELRRRVPVALRTTPAPRGDHGLYNTFIGQESDVVVHLLPVIPVLASEHLKKLREPDHATRTRRGTADQFHQLRCADVDRDVRAAELSHQLLGLFAGGGPLRLDAAPSEPVDEQLRTRRDLPPALAVVRTEGG